MSKQTIPPGIIPSEQITSVSEKTMSALDRAKRAFGEYSEKAMKAVGNYGDKASESVNDLLGQAKDKLCDRTGLICFDKKKLGTAVIILVIIAVILCIVAAVVAYYMGKQYAQVDNVDDNRYPYVELYDDYQGNGINYR